MKFSREVLNLDLKEKYGVYSFDDIRKKFTDDEINNMDGEEFSKLLESLDDNKDEEMIPGTFYAAKEFKESFYNGEFPV